MPDKAKILTFYQQRKRMPSYAEVADLMGFASKNTAYQFVAKLIAEGSLTKDEKGKLLPPQQAGVPLLGQIEAGFPSPAEEELCDTLSLDDFLISRREATYLLRVKGDSMIDAGILEGDLVLVERTTDARIGDIVIAEIDGEWTIKYLRKRAGNYYLAPANKNYPPITPDGDLKISAVVISVIRKMR